MYFSSIPSPYVNDISYQTLHAIDQIVGIGEIFPQSDDMDAYSPIYYNYIRITHYQSFNIILLTCKVSTSLIATSSINLYLPHATGSHHFA
jgi:hypothetical protein